MTSSNWMENPASKTNPTVVVGVGAGIAAYKVAFLVREFRKANWNVHVIPTPRSTNFVGVETWKELSENPVATGVFSDETESHVRLARAADLVVLAPATADMLARMAVGIADDLLTTTVLASSAPVLACPAMHTQMWLALPTQQNIASLRRRGWRVLEPDSGDLSSGDSGKGRLPNIETIFESALDLYASQVGAQVSDSVNSVPDQLLEGRHVVVTAGGTREALDPVRFLGNHSTGTQGVAIAEEALALGADVTLIGANMSVSPPKESERFHFVEVQSTEDMFKAVRELLTKTDALVMAAAVADYRPSRALEQKIKKTDDNRDLVLTLERTPDILKSVSASPDRPSVLVGFAAETGDDQQVLEYGAQKAVRKNADLLAVNRVGGGAGFGDVDNTLTYFDASGNMVGSVSGSKSEVAADLLQRVSRLF